MLDICWIHAFNQGARYKRNIENALAVQCRLEKVKKRESDERKGSKKGSERENVFKDFFFSSLLLF